jgi:hypothetical protein
MAELRDGYTRGIRACVDMLETMDADALVCPANLIAAR